LGKNIKHLKYCWDKGEYTESEFKRLIVEHVDKEMFQIDVSVPNVVVEAGQNDVNDVNECDDEYQQQQQRNECINVGDDNNNNNNQCNLNYEEALERIKQLEEENKTLKSKMSTNSSNNNIKCKQKNKKRTKSVGLF
jgi:predicted nuclease with TOPRIM domain